MAKASKSTKKFQAKHLKRTLDHRKEGKKHKQLLAKHKGGRGKGKKPQVDDDVETVQVKENPFDVETDSEDEKADFGVIDKKGKDDADKKESFIDDEAEEASDGDEDDGEDDDIFGELDELAEGEYEVDEDYDDGEEEDEVPLKSKKSKTKSQQENSGDEEETLAQNEDGKVEVTMDLVKEWDTALIKSPSLKTIKNITLAFKAAVNVNQTAASDASASTMESEYKYFVTRETVFNRLLFLTLKKLPVAIAKLFPLTSKFNKEHNIQVRQVKNSSKLKQLSAVLKQHAFSLITMLSDITRSNLNLKFILLTLSSIYDIFPYLLSFRTLLKKLIGAMVGLWSTLILTPSSASKNLDGDSDENDDDKQVNIDSFLDINVLTFSVIINLSKEYASNILETIINTCYEAFLKRALTLQSSVSLDTSATDLVAYKKFKLIEFLKTGLIDLFQIDVNLSYQVAFKYIRKLSIHLRNFLKKNSNIKNENDNSKNLRLIYNWQFVQSLDFWTKFLANTCGNTRGQKKPSSLNELIYPVVQISLGTMKLNNNAIYFPLKFYLFKSLTHLSAQTTVYIPLFNIFIELLLSSIFNKNFTASKSGSGKKNTQLIQSNMYMNTHGIKVSKNSVNTSEYQIYVINKFLNSLQEYLFVYVESLAFPEFSFIISKRLKQFTKKHSSVHKKNKVMIFFVKEVNNLVSKINENSQAVSTKRDQLDRFDPVNQPTLTTAFAGKEEINVESLPLYRYLKVKQDVLQEGDRLHMELLASEQINEASGANDRKKAQETAGEEYFGKEGKKKSKSKKSAKRNEEENEDVEMSDEYEDGSSTTESI